MTGTARSMRMILAVHLLQRIGTRPPIPNSRLSGIAHIGQTPQKGACETRHRRSARLGDTAMSGIIVITAAGIFVIGVVVGIIVMVSHGIRHEQHRLDEVRRYREEHGIWDDSDAPEYFLKDAPD